MIKKVDFDPETYKTLEQRQLKYVDATFFLIKEVGDMKRR
jgi:hypothetical protein